MLDSVKLTTCLNFWYHQLVNLSQKALDTVQWYSGRWFIVCFSVANDYKNDVKIFVTEYVALSWE